MSAWFCRSRSSVAGRSGRPPAKLTIARRVHVMWSSQSLRMSSCRRWAFAVRAAAAWSARRRCGGQGRRARHPRRRGRSRPSWRRPPSRCGPGTGERRCIRSLLVGDVPFASGAASALRVAAEVADLPRDLVLDVERLLPAARRAARCARRRARGSPPRARVDRRPLSARSSASTSSGPRRGARAARCARSSSWRISSSRCRRGRRSAPARAAAGPSRRGATARRGRSGRTSARSRQRRDRDERPGGHHGDDDDAEGVLHA